jgi:predicted AlkP superfamily pyrophosphatase or phosphodiesterase
MWTLDAETDRIVKSGPNWVGILSGCNSGKSKVVNNECVLPRCTTLLNNDTAVYSEWDKIRCYSENIGLYKLSHGANMTTIMSVIDSKYKFVFLHLDELDAISHSYGSGHIRYKNKLKQLDDEVVGPIINYVDSTNATLIITADHASDLFGYGHSWLPVPIILYGKGISKGKIWQKTRNRDVYKFINQMTSSGIEPE